MADPSKNEEKPRCKYFEDTTILQQSSSGKKCFHLQHLQDELLEKRISKKVQLTEHHNVELDVTEKIAIELSDLKRKRFVEEKKRQQLRETNQELKDLETKLRAAYVSKALAIQLAEREAARRHEQDLQREENELIEKARITQNEWKQMEMQKDYKKKMSLKQDLLSQMDERQQQKAIKYEEFLKEKEIIDEIIRKINEEQLEEMREKLSRKIQFKEEMDEFLRAQELWKEKQRREAEEENRLLLELMNKKEEDKAEKEKLRKMELEKRHEISQQIGNKILETETQKRRRGEKLQELYIAERKALDDEKLRDQLEKTLRERIITQLQLEVQREDMKKRKLEQEAEDRRYKEELAHIAEKREEMEKDKDKKRHEKMLDHRHAIQECLEEKKRRRAEEFAIILKTREQELQEEKRMQQIIEEERIRMLKEHAVNLLGYLPPGILKESDREHLPLPPKKNAE